jgi:hypothetical protein
MRRPQDEPESLNKSLFFAQIDRVTRAVDATRPHGGGIRRDELRVIAEVTPRFTSRPRHRERRVRCGMNGILVHLCTSCMSTRAATQV